ncbi:MAG: hypothetical protein IRY97_04810 [Thermomicrobiaceae bacterium]|nr:hypothetical protein [Thermomicrobiaceae bacterium]
MVGPLVAPVMGAALAVALLSLPHPALGAVAGLVAWAPARLVVAVAEGAAAVPGAAGQTLPLGWTAVVLIYLAAAALVAFVLFEVPWRRARPRP